MVDILVRNVDGDTAKRLKSKAKAAGKSVSEIAREALIAAAKPGKQDAWAEADRIRAKIRARLGRDRNVRSQSGPRTKTSSPLPSPAPRSAARSGALCFAVMCPRRKRVTT
jgi:plasmid stability protein